MALSKTSSVTSRAPTVSILVVCMHACMHAFLLSCRTAFAKSPIYHVILVRGCGRPATDGSVPELVSETVDALAVDAREILQLLNVKFCIHNKDAEVPGNKWIVQEPLSAVLRCSLDTGEECGLPVTCDRHPLDLCEAVLCAVRAGIAHGAGRCEGESGRAALLQEDHLQTAPLAVPAAEVGALDSAAWSGNLSCWQLQPGTDRMRSSGV